MSDFLLHVDMDGVLADFQVGYETQTKIPWHVARNLPDELFWNNISHIQDFFYNLPLMPDAMVLWKGIEFLNPRILTAIPRVSTRPSAGDEKRRAIAKHFGEHVIVNLSPSAEAKVKFYRPGTKDILIDDRLDTINSWNNAGGIGIYHTSAQSTLTQLRNLKII